MDDIIVAFSKEELDILVNIIGVCSAEAKYGNYKKEYRQKLQQLVESMNTKLVDVLSGEVQKTNEVVRELRRQGWSNARNSVSVIPYWFTDPENHGFDLWEDENGYAQESGARIEVMKVLDNNPYSDDYVDPNKERAKRRVAKIRRRLFEEGKNPDND